MPEKSPETVSLAEERLSVSKRQVETGRVRIETQTDVGEELAKASLESSDVEVTRIALNEIVLVAPVLRTVGNVTIIPVLEEVLIVEKRLLLKEEIHVTRHTSVEDVSIPVSVRKQRATITRT